MNPAPSRAMLNKYLLPSFGEIKLSGASASYIYLCYLVFMKKLSNAAHVEAFKRKMIGVTPRDVLQASKKLCRDFSLRHNDGLAQRRGSRPSTSSTSSRKSRRSLDSDQNVSLRSKQKSTSQLIKEMRHNRNAQFEKREVNRRNKIESSEGNSSLISLTMSESDSSPSGSDVS